MHGYTLDDVRRIAGRATADYRRAAWLSRDLVRQAAQDAIIDTLLAATDRPDVLHLLWAAETAIDARCARELQTRGCTYQGHTRPRFAAYWHIPPDGQFVEQLVDRIAARQVWAALNPRDRAVLHAFVITDGSYTEAAATMGCTLAAYHIRIQAARRRARVLWHWPDPPSRHWGTDRRRGDGAQSISYVMSRRKTAA